METGLHIHYKHCKFDTCAFLHVNHTDKSKDLKRKIEVILSKINDINNTNKELEAKIRNRKLLDIETKLDTFTEIRQDIHTKDVSY